MALPRLTAVKMTITYHPNGQVQLDAPLHDKLLCYGMLGMAKELVIKYEPKVVPVDVMKVNGVSRN